MIVSQRIIDILREAEAIERRLRAEEKAAEKAEASKKPDQSQESQR